MSKRLQQRSAINRQRFSPFLILMIGFSFGIPSAGFAQNWQVQPIIALTAEYDDNIRLDEEGEVDTAGDSEVSGGVLDAEVRIWRQSPTGLARVRPRIRSSNYGSDADSNDYFLDTFFQHRRLKSDWMIEARYSAEEVVTAELDDRDFDDPDIENPLIDDSGIVTVESRRDQLVLSPRVNFRLSQRTTLLFQGQIIDTSYDSGTIEFADYKNLYYEGSIRRALSPKVSLRVSLFGRSYDPDLEGSKSDSYGSFVTFDRRISERNSVFVRAGYENVDISQLSAGLNVKRSEGSPVFGVGIRRQFKTSRMVLDVRHSVNPSGLAELRERNMFRARFERDFSERTRATISARYEDTNSLSESTSSVDREFARVELDLVRQLSRTWSIIGGYSYTRQEFSDAPNAEASNSFYLGVRYAPPRQQ